jgi:hypothetical protein
MAKLTGRRLNREIGLGAAHAMYHKDGYWFDQLQRFPGVLFDRQGYVLFKTRGTYDDCPELRHPQQARVDGRPGTLSVPNGISTIRTPAYVRDDRVAALYAEFGLD